MYEASPPLTALIDPKLLVQVSIYSYPSIRKSLGASQIAAIIAPDELLGSFIYV